MGTSTDQPNRQRSDDWFDLPVQRKFADKDPTGYPLGRNDFLCDKYGNGDGQIEARSFFLDIGRREIDGDALGGKMNPVFLSADRTRSRLSRTVVSGRPTTENCGRPPPISTSTSIRWASRPTSAALSTFASMASPKCLYAPGL